ncbi:sulfate adenylyltransferase [Candidatus Woesearchaeota archaeon]|nr:sulfate adenylyltransferase [Candidatus Woesearchaeota archaeon]
MNAQQVKLIVTLGPSTNTQHDLLIMKDHEVDFVRTNMSHSSLEELEQCIKRAKEVGIPFIIDTEGSQIRTGDLCHPSIELEENEEIKLYKEKIVGDKTKISLTPGYIIDQLEEGDLIHVDFDTLILRVSSIATKNQGYILAKAISKGFMGKNKGIVVDPSQDKTFSLPPLSPKDYKSISMGLRYGVEHIAVSFVRSKETIDEVRRACQGKMKIISKIECVDGLEHLDEIIENSDYLLIDRGDLSKEIPLERIPLTQKLILQKARKRNVGVFVATNFLETMVDKRKPTRAEVHDVINTIMDGASGVVLSAETAIGKYPLECINMINRLRTHAQQAIELEDIRNKEEKVVQHLEKTNYLGGRTSTVLIPPHGGKLVNRISKEQPAKEYLAALPKVHLDINKQMDVDQIAVGTYSPIEGFMDKADFESVLSTMRLANGTVWPLPIILDVSVDQAHYLNVGSDVALVNENEETMAILHLTEKYLFDKENMKQKMYNTTSTDHPGVRMIDSMNPVLLAGKITLLKRRSSDIKEHELTPKQVRRLFEERGWSKVVGFHTRNVIHRSHEFIQLQAMKQEFCDGLFVHPVVGKKKAGDFNAKYIVQAYETMMREFYPKNKVIFSVFSTYSRYAGPREALFTALCRKNFGCSHFIVGRDHTGVGNFYHPLASHRIFDQFPDIGIKAVRFNQIFYSPKRSEHVHEIAEIEHPADDKLEISGTQARAMFERGEQPPAWFMRPEISQQIIDAVARGEEVFVPKEAPVNTPKDKTMKK